MSAILYGLGAVGLWVWVYTLDLRVKRLERFDRRVK